MTRSRTLAYLVLLATALIWGAAGPVIKFTLGGIPALPFLTYRFAISALLALAAIPFGGLKLPRDRRTRGLALLYGFLTSTVALGLLFFGLERTTVLDLTFMALAGPLLVVAAGAIFLREHVPFRERVGIGIALAGTAFVVLEPILKSGAAQFSGNLLIILYLLVNTVSAVLVKDLMRLKVSPVALTNLSFIIGFLTILPFAILDGGPLHLSGVIKNLTLPYHLGVLFMAVLSGNLAYTLWARAHRSIEVGEAALFAYLYPIFAAPLAVFWLGETITVPFIIGAAVIAAGVFIAEYRSVRRKIVHNS
ncbi:MAG: DMT family transporter [Patescibacteria group bacterium]